MKIYQTNRKPMKKCLKNDKKRKFIKNNKKT